MLESFLLLFIGTIFIICGIFNIKGNVKMMHSYHYKRVSKKDLIPFGKKIGLGMFFIGTSILFNGILYAIYLYKNIKLLEILGNTITISGFSIGIIIIFYAMFKYNKGIF